MWWLEVAKAATFASINPISFKSTRSDRIWWMKLWLKHLLVPYMPPYQGDLAELTGSFRPFMTFVAFIWPFRQTFVPSKFLFEYILEDWPITCGFKASQIAICKIVKPFSICGGYALRQPFVKRGHLLLFHKLFNAGGNHTRNFVYKEWVILLN